MDNKALQIFLVDCSSSMFIEDVFSNVPMNRAKLLSSQIARSIFEMENIGYKEGAYLCVILFDQGYIPFIDFLSVNKIFNEYKNIKDLETRLYDSMCKLGGKRDIGKALEIAYSYADIFYSGRLSLLDDYNIDNYDVMHHSVFNLSSGDDFVLPVIRIILLTGLNNDANDVNADCNVRKYHKGSLEKFYYMTNFLSIIFIGNSQTSYFNRLIDLIDNCVVHNKKNVLLINQANEVQSIHRFCRLRLNSPNYSCEECVKIRRMCENS